MTEEEKLVELTRVYDQIEADLLAAFLENAGVEFQMRRSARTMAPALPTAGHPTVFMVYEKDLDDAKSLLEDYNTSQSASLPPDPEEADDENDGE